MDGDRVVKARPGFCSHGICVLEAEGNYTCVCTVNMRIENAIKDVKESDIIKWLGNDYYRQNGQGGSPSKNGIAAENYIKQEQGHEIR